MRTQLSLICPVYKVYEYIPALLDSLIKGVNSSEIEVIFVDDCCPQMSGYLLSSLLERNKDIINFTHKVIFLKNNHGQGYSRNKGLDYAKGRYIGFIDSDDLIIAEYWSFLSNRIAVSDADIIEFGFEEFDDGETPDLSMPVDNNFLKSSQLNPFLTGFFVWSRIFNKDLLKGVRFPSGVIYEDVSFVTEAFSKANNTERNSAKLVMYRKRAGSTTGLRSSDYSYLLINMISSTEGNIHNIVEREKWVKFLAFKALIILLKGLRIYNWKDRRLFYELCLPSVSTLKSLIMRSEKSISSMLSLLGVILLCRIGRF